MSAALGRGLVTAGFVVSASMYAVSAHAGLLSPTCTVSGSTLNFGNYNPLSGSTVRINSAITISCSQTVGGSTVNYTIALSTGASNSYATRTLLNGVHSLNYNLYTSSSYGTVWGDGSGGSSTVSGSGNLALLGGTFTNTATVYGQIPALQTTVIPGAYSDTITITLTY